MLTAERGRDQAIVHQVQVHWIMPKLVSYFLLLLIDFSDSNSKLSLLISHSYPFIKTVFLLYLAAECEVGVIGVDLEIYDESDQKLKGPKQRKIRQL